MNKVLAATDSSADLVAGVARATPLPELSELQLRTLNHRFVQAYARPDTAFMAALTAEDFRMLDARGQRQDRHRFLAGFDAAGSLGSVSYDQVQVRLFGRVALVQGLFEALDAKQQPVRLRYTDVFYGQGGRWQLVAAQNTPLAAGADRSLQRGSEPPHEPWRGTDPTGDEAGVLSRLNEAYVDAYRRCDVGWYAAHLSADFTVTNGDGSFGDRNAALTAFARPSFATHFKSFPVGAVNIRRFDAVALIEAQNDWEAKDGRTGISRYTDIWVQQPDARWCCVAAHITSAR